TNETSSSSSASKITQTSSFGPIDNYIVKALSVKDTKKFHWLLLCLTISCGWALHWVNKPEAAKLFEFLNLLLKLPDRCILEERILNEAVGESNKAMLNMLKEDQGRPHVWKALNISLEHKTHLEVIEKINRMLNKLNSQSIKVISIVTDSEGAYTAA
ncbi:9259_t:CDS:2, partial [Cetraspora pellucida]